MSKLKVNEIAPFSGDGVGIGAPNVQPSAILNISSTEQGILIPRMTTVQRNAIPFPAKGLLIYNLDDDTIEQYDGTTWTAGVGIQSINGLTAQNQILSTGSTGTTPNWTQSGGNTNTLNIPLASGGSVTSGTISHPEYDFFSNKLNPTSNTLYVVKNTILGPQDFNSIKDAVDSITDASASNPYIIRIGPGVYIEDTITMQPYVWVQGAEQDQTIIQINATNKHVIVGADNSGISKCLLRGATDAGFAAIYYQSLVGTSNTSFFVEDVRFGNNDTLVISDGQLAPTAVFIENCKIGGVHQFNHGFLAQAGGRVIVRNSTTTSLTAPLPDYIFKGTGTGSQIVLNGIQARSASTTSGACIHLADGATLRALSVNIRMFGTALFVENSGSASIVDAVGVLCEGNTMDIVVDHPAADGTFSGSASHQKITVNPSSGFSVIISCNNLPNDGTGMAIVGEVLQGDRYDRMANLSLIARKSTTLGVIEDEEAPFVEFDTGLNVQVLAGRGFLNDPTDLYLKQIEWEDTTVALPSDSTNYIYVDTNGDITINPSLPSLETVIVLGRVNTSATEVRFIENSDLPMNHYGNKTENFLRGVLGPVFKNGCLVTESANPRQLDVTAGEYFYGVTDLTTSTRTAVDWESFYRDGLGGWNSITSQDTLSNTQYDDNSGTLVSIPTGEYARHHLYVVGDGGNEEWFLVYAQATYATLAEAVAAPLPTVPPFMSDAVVRVAGIIVQEGVTNIVDPIIDLRPRLGFAAPSGTAVTNHGSLSGLLNDDHPQYLPLNGSRSMTSNFNVGGQNITNVNLVDGVDVSNHSARHLPNGSDPLTTAAPAANITATTTNATGTANSLARSDHGHAVSTGAASTQVPDQANATGVSANLARADHGHNIPTAAPSGTIGANSTNSQGLAATFSRADHGHQVATGTPSTQLADQSNSAGTSNSLARADHGHAIPTAVAVNIGSANAQGVSTSFAKADHVHQGIHSIHVNAGPDRFGDLSLQEGSGITIVDDGSGNFTISAPGSTTDEKVKASATDTTPDYLNAKVTAGLGISVTLQNPGGNENLNISINAGSPVSITDATNAAGIATTFSRSDHTHAHGDRAGGTLHAAATTSVNGFMSSTDKTKLDALITNATPQTRNLIAGAGLTGGGDLSADRTFNVVANADGSIVVNANDIQVGVISNTQHGSRAGGTLHADATTSVSGFMSGADKTKLDALITNAAAQTITITAGAGLTGGGDLSANRTISMPNVGTAGTYGSATQVPVFTTDAQGRVSAVTNTAIQITQSQVTGLTTDLSGKANLAGGNIFTGTQQINSGSFIIGGTTIQTSGEWNVAAGTYTDPDVGTLYDAKFGGPNRGIAVRGTSYFLGQVGIGAQAPVASAKLQIDSTTQGFLAPRMTAAQRQAIATPATGLQVYDTTYNEILVYNGSSWRVTTGVPIQITSGTGALSTTSAAYATITGLTTTPSAGTYEVYYSVNASITADSNGDVAIFLNNDEQVETTRSLGTTNSTGTNTAKSSLSSKTVITVNGTDVVSVRFRENGGGTLGVTSKVFILVPIARP